MRVQCVLPNNTTQCPRPELELVPLDPETSALTMRSPCHIVNGFRKLQVSETFEPFRNLGTLMISPEVSFFCVTFVSESKFIQARELSTRENYSLCSSKPAFLTIS